MASDVLNRLRQVDWMGKPEPTICSELVMPVLTLLGYGEHTPHKVAEQQSYPLKDVATMLATMVRRRVG